MLPCFHQNRNRKGEKLGGKQTNKTNKYTPAHAPRPPLSLAPTVCFFSPLSRPFQNMYIIQPNQICQLLPIPSRKKSDSMLKRETVPTSSIMNRGSPRSLRLVVYNYQATSMEGGSNREEGKKNKQKQQNPAVSDSLMWRRV